MKDNKKGNLILFLDESGDHSLVKIDPQYPMFVLAGCIFESEYYEKVVAPEVEKFKRALFNNPKLILHTEDITHNRKGFERISDTEFRRHFCEI